VIYFAVFYSFFIRARK